MVLVLACNTACQQEAKRPDFNAVKPGMSAQQVEKLVGKPEKTANLVFVEAWKYPTYSKSILFNSDTVVEVIDDQNTPVDSVKNDLHRNVSSNTDSTTLEMQKALQGLK